MEIDRDAMRQMFVDCLVAATDALAEVGLVNKDEMTAESKALVVKLAGRGVPRIVASSTEK